VSDAGAEVTEKKISVQVTATQATDPKEGNKVSSGVLRVTQGRSLIRVESRTLTKLRNTARKLQEAESATGRETSTTT
jgi:hypothetical protein